VIAKKSININKTNNYLPPQIIAYIKDHDIWRWKPMSLFGICKQMWNRQYRYEQTI